MRFSLQLPPLRLRSGKNCASVNFFGRREARERVFLLLFEYRNCRNDCVRVLERMIFRSGIEKIKNDGSPGGVGDPSMIGESLG